MTLVDNEDVIIKLNHVGISYRQHTGLMRHKSFWALRDISFELYTGETLGVIGRNGAGKSSLLRLLAGIISQNKGEVVRHKDIVVSLLTLQVGFNPHLSGRENIVLSGIIQGMQPKQIEACMPDILAFAELGEFIHQPVKIYSTGMLARLGFAISMQVNPDVLLIDEVLGVGDADFKKKTTSVMKERILSDKSVVIVSHQMPALRELCDRIIWIENGVVKMIDVTDRVLEQYDID